MLKLSNLEILQIPLSVFNFLPAFKFKTTICQKDFNFYDLTHFILDILLANGLEPRSGPTYVEPDPWLQPVCLLITLHFIF